MKRITRLLTVFMLVLAVTACAVLPAAATELKTGIGVVEANGGLRVRAKPNTSAKILATAHDGDSVVIIRRVGQWYLVNYNLHIGYIHSDYVTYKSRENIDLGKGSVDPAVANLRSGPSTASSLVAQLKAGETVQIIGFNTNWYKVTYGSKTGYIRSDLVTLLEKPAQNYGTAATLTTNGSTGTGASSSSTSAGQKIADYALQYVGYRYVYGGADPSGFDCSGFVKYVFTHFGYKINRTATAQLADGYAVSRDSLQPGDVIYFGYGSTAQHVGIYIGNNQFVHAQNSSTGVVISSLSESWYANRYLTAHRIAG